MKKKEDEKTGVLIVAGDTLTEEEVRALPLEMRACYYLCEWSRHGIGRIVDIDSWANSVGHMASERYRNNDDLWELAVDDAKRMARKLLAFLKNYVLA